MFKSKLVSAIGLDIGSHSIKCVEIAHNHKDVIKLNRASIFPVTKGYASTLKTFFEAYPALPKSIRISLSGPSVIIRRIQLPIMTHSDLKGAIRFEAESHLPYAIEECALDFQILGQVPNQTVMNVLLVAAKRDFIQERLELLSPIGITPDVIDLDIFCIANAFEILHSGQVNKVYGLLNIGHQQSSLTVIQDKMPFFVRDISTGGLSVTAALTEIKGISQAEAETLKVSREEGLLSDLKAATQKGFESLIDELKNSIDFCEGEMGGSISAFWLSGGGAASFEAASVLSEAIAKPVSLWDNRKKMEIFKDVDTRFMEEHAIELNVAFGMALRGARQAK